MSDEPQFPAGWPAGVEPLFIEDLQRIGRNSKNELFWDGKRLVTTSQYVFTNYQRVLAGLAVIASLATIATGLNNASVFMCARGVRLLGCPAAAAPVIVQVTLPSTGGRILAR